MIVGKWLQWCQVLLEMVSPGHQCESEQGSNPCERDDDADAGAGAGAGPGAAADDHDVQE